MCGIVGLFLKNKNLEPALGDLLSRMLVTMSARGPDSAGVAIYGAGDDDKVKLTLRVADGTCVDDLRSELFAVTSAFDMSIRSSHIVLSISRSDAATVIHWLKTHKSDLDLVSVGENMEIYKEVGLPEHVVRVFGLSGMSGTHAIGHTRMATESAVTTNGAHPFSTENDSEVAAGYLTWRMRQGASLRDSLSSSLDDLDGFFTFVVGTRNGFAVLRDPIACKPAIMAESDDYVAFGSEYRALSVLPNIERARVFEPEPATVYAWEHP